MLLALYVCAQSVAWHVACAAGPHSSSATPPEGSSRTVSPRIALPDDGPIYDRTMEGPGVAQFQEAVKAFTRGQYAAARVGFSALDTLDSSSPLIPPMKAFLAELTLLEHPSDHARGEAVTLYRGIIGSYPKNPNAFRARS